MGVVGQDVGVVGQDVGVAGQDVGVVGQDVGVALRNRRETQAQSNNLPFRRVQVGGPSNHYTHCVVVWWPKEHGNHKMVKVCAWVG